MPVIEKVISAHGKDNIFVYMTATVKRGIWRKDEAAPK